MTTSAPARETLTTLSAVIDRTDEVLRQGALPGTLLVPTGFRALDESLDGGLRSGELVVLGGSEGVGTSTMAIQMVRNVVHAGGTALVFSSQSEAGTILQRLIALETATFAAPGSARLREIRRALEAPARDGATLEDRLAPLAGALEGLAVVRGYAGRLHLHEGAATDTNLATVEAAVADIEASTGARPLVVVDQLRLVCDERGPEGGAADPLRTVERLKRLALRLAVPVVAVTGADRERTSHPTRTRMHHLRGAAALAHVADVVLLLDEKFDVVARHHLVYDLYNADRFKEWVVLSVEKNRHGLDDVHLEFRKCFAEGRFDPRGQRVTEQLVEDRVFVD